MQLPANVNGYELGLVGGQGQVLISRSGQAPPDYGYGMAELLLN